MLPNLGFCHNEELFGGFYRACSERQLPFSFCENCDELLERALILLNLIMIVVQCAAIVYFLEWSVHTEHRVGERVDFKLNQQQGALELVHSGQQGALDSLSWCTLCCVVGP